VNGVLKDFLKKGGSQLTKVTYCSSMDRNRKPSYKEKTFYSGDG
jgi:hypothetical protein